MLFHSFQANHEYLILFIQLANVSSAIESFVTFYNSPISKILVNFLFFNMVNLL